MLIAAALAVKPDTPAKDGRASPEESRRNKSALLKVLKPCKVTNEPFFAHFYSEG